LAGRAWPHGRTHVRTMDHPRPVFRALGNNTTCSDCAMEEGTVVNASISASHKGGHDEVWYHTHPEVLSTLMVDIWDHDFTKVKSADFPSGFVAGNDLTVEDMKFTLAGFVSNAFAVYKNADATKYIVVFASTGLPAQYGAQFVARIKTIVRPKAQQPTSAGGSARRHPRSERSASGASKRSAGKRSIAKRSLKLKLKAKPKPKKSTGGLSAAAKKAKAAKAKAGKAKAAKAAKAKASKAKKAKASKPRKASTVRPSTVKPKSKGKKSTAGKHKGAKTAKAGKTPRR